MPATIAILDGNMHVGLADSELRRLAKLGHRCRKCSRRDLAIVVALGENGATTVAATMYIASLVGIKVFVTGQPFPPFPKARTLHRPFEGFEG